MTYGKLKVLTSGLLIGDNKLPKEDDQTKALLEMAYNYLVDKCQVLHLQTLDKSEEIRRLARGDYVVRKPEPPVNDIDELDVDDELGFAVASLIASYISDKKTNIHQSRATDMINSYNAKVDEFLESLPKLQGEADD